MITIALSDTEIMLLQGYARSPVELIRSKALTILARYKHVPLDTLRLMFNRNIRTLTRWIKDYSDRRISSIFSGMVGNEHASRLTRAQKQEIKKIIGLPPDKYGLPAEFWNVPKLKDYIKAEFGVVYESDVSYHYLLRFSGLSLKYPDKRSPNRNEAFILERIEQIREEIYPLLSDPNWIVFASDETRLQLEAEIRRAWLVKGKRTIVKTERSNEHQNYLGFLNQKDGECQIFPITRGNQKETIRVLKELTRKYPDRKVCVVWDNASWHKGKQLRTELTKQKQLANLHLINFPPYAPEHNPIEYVWQYAKSSIANRGNMEFSAIQESFLKNISNKIFNYKI